MFPLILCVIQIKALVALSVVPIIIILGCRLALSLGCRDSAVSDELDDNLTAPTEGVDLPDLLARFPRDLAAWVRPDEL